jgi:hypothetical protein
MAGQAATTALARGRAAPPGTDVPILISGQPRSGTTLMARLLGSHSEIAIPPTELGFFDGTFDPRKPIGGREQLEDRLRRLLSRDARHWGLDEEELLTRARTEIEPSYRGLFVLLLDAYRRHVGKRWMGEKTTNYQRWLDVLDGWFDDYRFIHVVRNPIDALASLKWYVGSPDHGPLPNRVDVLTWTHGWNASATLALRNAHARRRRYSCVRYEDLVDDPADVLARICAVLGVEPELDRMLAMSGYESVENSSFEQVAKRREYDDRIRRSDDVDRRGLLDPDEEAAVTSMCGPLADLLGYDIGPLRKRRGAFGRLMPGRVPARAALRFAAEKARTKLSTLSRGERRQS